MEWLLRLADWIIPDLIDRFKKIHHSVTNWELWIVEKSGNGPILAMADYARYGFDVRFQHRKRRTIGLHRLAVEFRRGVHCLFRDDEPHITSKRGSGMLTDIEIPPDRLILLHVHGDLAEQEWRRIKECDSVWFVGESIEGRKVEWRVRELSSSV